MGPGVLGNGFELLSNGRLLTVRFYGFRYVCLHATMGPVGSPSCLVLAAPPCL